MKDTIESLKNNIEKPDEVDANKKEDNKVFKFSFV